MPRLQWLSLLAAALLWAAAGGLSAQEPPVGLYDRPVLTLDPGVHTAPIIRADVDAAGQVAVTGAHDKTVRVWSLADGTLERTIRMPVGPGNVGKIYAVAISPDGSTIAAGGWMTPEPPTHIYVFDRATGAMTGRLGDLPNVVNHLAFSPDGARLAATLFGGEGLRVYDRGGDESWQQAWSDPDYGDSSLGVAFGPEGRLATTSHDNRLRLYDPDGTLLASVETAVPRPFGLAFNPVDGRLAVGFDGSPDVRLYDGERLSELSARDTRGINIGDLSEVAWSGDGATLYAGGSYDDGGPNPMIAWDASGAEGPRVVPAGTDTLMSLKALPDGALLAAAQDPWLGVVDADGTTRWAVPPVQMDPRAQMSNLAISDDGMLVEFGLRYGGGDRRRFDLAALELLPPAEDARVQPPEQDSLDVADWANSYASILDGTPLPLKRGEISRSLVIHPDGDRFVLGTEWYLRAFDAAGAELWRREPPGAVWAVNVTGDGRFAVAAYADGTIRWHRMEDGLELLALFPFADGENWVAWEPEGRYASTQRARGALRWVVNRGWDAVPEEVGAGRIRDSYAPDVIRRILPLGGTPEAVHAANQARRLEDFRRLTGGPVPGAQLHVLAVGIADYGAQATRLKLDWADDDAADIAAALAGQTDWPYRKGHQVALRDEEATALAILDQLHAIRQRMALAPEGNDIAVVSISGHGIVVGEGETEEFYLLPHGADIATPTRISRSGISGTELRARIAALAGVGRVLVLFDTCSSGAATDDGRELGAPAGFVRSLAGRNVTVLASSSATEVSREDPAWRNGAFTEAVLEAFGPDGDTDANGMISIGELTDYVGRRLPVLTAGAQTPSIEARLHGDLFASGM